MRGTTNIQECIGLCNILPASAKLFRCNNLSYFGVMIVPESDACHSSGTSELYVAYFTGTQIT